MVEEAISFCLGEMGEYAIRIHAQDEKRGFYEKCGFVGVTEPEMYANCIHLEMLYHGIPQ